MYDAVSGYNFIENIQISIIERFQNSDAQLFYWPQWTSCPPHRNSAAAELSEVIF